MPMRPISVISGPTKLNPDHEDHDPNAFVPAETIASHTNDQIARDEIEKRSGSITYNPELEEGK